MSWSPTLFRVVVALVAAFGVIAIPLTRPVVVLMPVDFQVRDVKTHVEVLGHVPLGAGANPPAGPVVVAARIRNRQIANANGAVARALQEQRMALAWLLYSTFV